MRIALLVLLLPILVCGCGPEKPAREAPPPLPKGEPEPANKQPTAADFPQEVRLPMAILAKAVEKTDDYFIYLNVNERGQVILLPIDQFKNAGGDTIDTLDNSLQLENYLKRRAKEDRDAAGPSGKNKPLRSIIVLRIDRNTPFEKVAAHLKASRRAGYNRFQVRALMAESNEEGQFPLVLALPQSGAVAPPSILDDQPRKYTVVARAADTGSIAKLLLREDDAVDPGLDFGVDMGGLHGKLVELMKQQKDLLPKLTIAMDGNLIYAYTVQLLDVANRAGIKDITPHLIDPKER